MNCEDLYIVGKAVPKEYPWVEYAYLLSLNGSSTSLVTSALLFTKLADARKQRKLLKGSRVYSLEEAFKNELEKAAGILDYSK